MRGLENKIKTRTSARASGAQKARMKTAGARHPACCLGYPTGRPPCTHTSCYLFASILTFSSLLAKVRYIFRATLLGCGVGAFDCEDFAQISL